MYSRGTKSVNSELVQLGAGWADANQGLESKDTKLVDVVQSLGEYLTDEDATLRAKGS